MALVRVRMVRDYFRRRPNHEPAHHVAGSFYLLPVDLALPMARRGAVEVDEASPEDRTEIEALLAVHADLEAMRAQVTAQREREAVLEHELDLAKIAGLVEQDTSIEAFTVLRAAAAAAKAESEAVEAVAADARLLAMCPECGAKASEPCLDGVTPVGFVHRERLEAAAEVKLETDRVRDVVGEG